MHVGLGGVMMKWEVEECGWKWLRGCTARRRMNDVHVCECMWIRWKEVGVHVI